MSETKQTLLPLASVAWALDKLDENSPMYSQHKHYKNLEEWVKERSKMIARQALRGEK